MSQWPNPFEKPTIILLFIALCKLSKRSSHCTKCCGIYRQISVQDSSHNFDCNRPAPDSLPDGAKGPSVQRVHHEATNGVLTNHGQPVPRPDPTWRVGIAHFQQWGWRYPSCAHSTDFRYYTHGLVNIRITIAIHCYLPRFFKVNLFRITVF